MRKNLTLAVALMVCALTTGSLFGAEVDATWIGGTGNWGEAADWDIGVVPSNGTDTYSVFIDGGDAASASVVTLDLSATIDTLSVDLDDRLAIAESRSLALVGNSIANAGAIEIANTGRLWLGNTSFTFSGGGSIALMGPDARMSVTVAGARLTNEDHVIQGCGFVGEGNPMALTNRGTIDASAWDGNVLVVEILGEDNVNTGTLRASGGGVLELHATLLNLGGTIEALDGSRVELRNSDIQYGTFTTAGTGA
ncbi:MAG: hypothetical protein JXA69_17855, partial [Phycisphaerae bacterium]|nr:hypothetical protein [Phycisphaerae bacterium]